MLEIAEKINSIFRIPINLIRLEITFGAFFCFLFGFFIEYFSDLDFDIRLSNGLSIGIFLIALLSFIPRFNKKNVRFLSNLVYLFGFSLVLYVVYLNDFNHDAFFLLTINYGFYNFSLSSIKLFLRLNIVLWFLTFIVLAALNFETVTPIYFVGIRGFSE